MESVDFHLGQVILVSLSDGGHILFANMVGWRATVPQAWGGRPGISGGGTSPGLHRPVTLQCQREASGQHSPAG